MSITVTCECGKQLRVKDEYAGKRGKCPSCGRVIQIPAAPAPEVPPPANVPPPQVPPPSPVCPNCAKPMAPAAVFCIECGFDKRTGKVLRPQL